MLTGDPTKRTEPLKTKIRLREQDLFRINYLAEKLLVEPHHIIEEAIEQYLDALDWANASRLGMTDEERRTIPKFRKRREPTSNPTDRVQDPPSDNGGGLNL